MTTVVHDFSNFMSRSDQRLRTLEHTVYKLIQSKQKAIKEPHYSEDLIFDHEDKFSSINKTPQETSRNSISI